ncbi:uncharacterized protein LOC114333974 isoform X13 [Diabrotica virgifera virgifera]|nr:uncharacterized protein LOC114333974 isoform X13 [Diabrotica virgifera virgifera]
MKCKVKIKKEVEEYEQNDIELSTSVDLESGFKNEPVEDYPGMECKVEVKKEIEEYDQNDIELSTSVDLGDLKNEPGKDYPGCIHGKNTLKITKTSHPSSLKKTCSSRNTEETTLNINTKLQTDQGPYICQVCFNQFTAAG